MVLLYIIAFAVLKILRNLFPWKSFCLQITAEVSKITKSVQSNLIFISIEP